MQFLRLSCLRRWCFARVAQAPNTYTFAVAPQFSSAQLYREWWPVLERVSRETGVALELKIAAFLPQFGVEAPDFAMICFLACRYGFAARHTR